MSLLRKRCLIIGLCLGSTGFAAFAQSPFAGDWKMNNDKSKMTGEVLEFVPAADGAIKITLEDRSYNFKTDGKEYAGVTGAKNIWKKVNDHTYQSTTSRNGILLTTTSWKISDDEKKLVAEDKGTMPSGKGFDDFTTYTRVAGSKGLMGSWKDMDVKLKEDTVMSLKAGSGDSIHWIMSDMKATVDLSMDGKECKPTGPTVPPGLTLAATKTGPRSFAMTEKINGRLLEKMDYKLSEDGKVLTEVVSPPDGKAPATIIYDKQTM